MTSAQQPRHDPEQDNTLTPCPRCRAHEAQAATLTDRFVYLRCRACHEVWSIEERRAFPRARVRPMASIALA